MSLVGESENMGIFTRVDVDQLRTFLLQRQTKEGGFSTVPSLPSTIEDTFYATDILALLEQLEPEIHLRPLVDSQRLADFIRKKHKEEESRLPLRLRYYLYRIAENIPGVPFFPEDHVVCTRQTYENLFYLKQLGRPAWLAKHGLPAPDLDHCSCKDVFYFLQLQPVTDTSQFGTIAGWLRACQNGDGGFGFFPGTTSFMENCYYCLTALSLMQSKPSEPEQAEQFILSCQTGAGGFARSIVGAPFLESSWYAVNIVHGLAV